MKRNVRKYPGYLKLGRVSSMRYLYFDAQAGLTSPSTSFEMIYDSLLNAPGGYEGPKENRIVSRIFDKLEAIGTATRRNNQDAFDLNTGLLVHCVALEDAEFDLVVKVMNSIRWTGTYTRKAVELFDWLERTPREQRPPEAVPEAREAAQA